MEECICQVLEDITGEAPVVDAARVVPAVTWVIPAGDIPRWAADGDTGPLPPEEAAAAASVRWLLLLWR